MTTQEKLQLIRDLMSEHQLDAFIILPTDPHQSEYIADHWKLREWLSGFTGSAGSLVVTHNFAGVWTDSRYFIQANQELENTGIELVRLKVPHSPEYIQWLSENLETGNTVGLDGSVVSEALVQQLRKSFADRNIAIHCDLDLASHIWKKRPPLSSSSIENHSLAFAGKSRQEKIQQLRDHMKKDNLDYILLSALDDIAWLLNLRGQDVEYNPVFYSYTLISKDSIKLFAKPEKFDNRLKEQLHQEGIEIVAYENIYRALGHLEKGASIQFSAGKISHHLFQSIPMLCHKVGAPSPVALMKACKGDEEIKNIENAMIKDGRALVKFFRWLENSLEKEEITEYSLDAVLGKFRAEQDGYKGNSFATIAGYKDHGAIVHYCATQESAHKLQKDGLLLLDSGAQYLDGTTDITRTLCLGTPKEEEIMDYTLVLKGMIGLTQAVFPEGTRGFQLDSLARQFLWKRSKNYGHGTGHGVGYYLNVHEGPQGISTNPAITTPLQVGMIQSNEPGFYREGKYGIRLENLIVVKEHSENLYGKFLCFDTLTLYPLERNLMDIDMLCEEEKTWINQYHNKVYELLSPGLSREDNAWLLHKTRELGF